jgi:hypothetical protein
VSRLPIPDCFRPQSVRPALLPLPWDFCFEAGSVLWLVLNHFTLLQPLILKIIYTVYPVSSLANFVGTSIQHNTQNYQSNAVTVYQDDVDDLVLRFSSSLPAFDLTPIPFWTPFSN